MRDLSHQLHANSTCDTMRYKHCGEGCDFRVRSLFSLMYLLKLTCTHSYAFVDKIVLNYSSRPEPQGPGLAWT